MRLNRFIMCIVLLGAFTLPAGCGKKAPPFLPKPGEAFSLQVEGLKAVTAGDQIRLTGRVVVSRSHRWKQADVVACRVFHVRYPLDSPPCEGCPISFTAYKEVRPDLSGNGRFLCATTVKKKPGIHYFMVQLVGPGGTVGTASNRAKLIVE